MNASIKHIKARNNDPVFTRVKSGVYSARLLGYKVTLIRAEHNDWHCIDAHTRERLGEGATRNEAMEASYNHVVSQELSRLDWVLADQPYRSYGGTRGEYHKEHGSNVITLKNNQWNVFFSETFGVWWYTDNNDRDFDNIRGPFNSEEQARIHIQNHQK